MTRNSLRNLRIALWSAVALGMLGSAWVFLRPPPPTAAPAAGADIGRGDYRLTAGDGTTFTQDSLVGAPSLVFFGFTHCPDVCPTTLSDIALWQDGLGDLAQDLRVFVITVDPERDTPAIMADYVGWLPGATGLSGTPAEVARAVAAFRVFVARVPLDGGGYTMNHAAYVMQFGADGRYSQIFGYQEDSDQVVAKLRRALAG